MRAVRRHVFPGDSAAGQGIVWEWQNDEGGWSPYEMNVCVFLEQARATNHQRVDLGPLGYNYEVDFVAQVQTNKTTRFRRSVQRRLDAPYPVTTSTTPLHTGVGCSCQQCWPNSGTGPITTRSRHSMTNFPNSSTTHQVPGRTASVSSSNVGFVPYNKPTLTGARSTPRLNAQSALVLAQTGSLSTALAASNGVRYRSQFTFKYHMCVQEICCAQVCIIQEPLCPRGLYKGLLLRRERFVLVYPVQWMKRLPLCFLPLFFLFEI